MATVSIPERRSTMTFFKHQPIASGRTAHPGMFVAVLP